MTNIEIRTIKSQSELQIAFAIRRIVFVQGQNVPPDKENDMYENTSTHYLAFINDGPCGTARWRITEDGKIKLERFAVLSEFRGKGIGKAMVEKVLSDLPTGRNIYLNAQFGVISFYEGLGFIPTGPVFEECGILHRKMIYQGKGLSSRVPT